MASIKTFLYRKFQDYQLFWTVLNIINLIWYSKWLILLFMLLFYSSYKFVVHECYSKGKLMQKETHFGMYTGCMVKVNNNFIPMDNYRAVE